MKWLRDLLAAFSRPLQRPKWMHPNLMPHQQDMLAMLMDADALRMDWENIPSGLGKIRSMRGSVVDEIAYRLDRCPPGWKDYPGRQVQKKSGKPFKSGSKINTVKGIVEHPVLIGPAFTFEEDDSAVAVWQVELAA